MKRCTGFTLIELLVAIAIIALLIGILLPVLGTSRDAARTTICMANVRSVSQANAVYNTEWNGWIAGPNTSGLDLEKGGAYGGNLTSPVQEWDYISPLLGDRIGVSSANRLQKYVDIFEHEFRCPVNEVRYKQRFRGPGLPMSGHPRLLSYLTPAMMHLVPFSKRSEFRNTNETDSTFAGMTLPAGYEPRIDFIGPPAEKVFTFEGARYWYGAINGYDYSTGTRSSGLVGSPQGNFLSRGPAFGGQGEPYGFRVGPAANRRPTKNLIDGGFRHNEKSHHGFYDGHVELMNLTDASNPRQLVPSGTIVGSTGVMFDPGYHRVSRGDVLD